jgi:general stress protein 26
MSEHVQDKNNGDAVSAAKKIEDLYALIDDIDIAMMTTRLPDGQMVSRPMDTQPHRPGVDLWFMARNDSHKIDEITHEAHVNLGYYKDGEWVSVSGIATLSRDRALIRELYQPDWKAWLEDQGGDRDGGPDDPRIVIIDVRALSVTYFKRTQPKPVAMFNVLRAMVTGEAPKVGEERHIDGALGGRTD